VGDCRSFDSVGNRLNADIDYTSLLQGRYEAERLPNDFSPERIVPDFTFKVINPQGLLYCPFVGQDYLARGGAITVCRDRRTRYGAISPCHHKTLLFFRDLMACVEWK